jgi:hypothetical protein
MQADGAHASGVEGIPFIAAGAEPFLFLAGRPAAQRAANACVGGIVGLFFLKLNRADSKETHVRYY